MIVLGLTGSIGMGKSTAAGMLRDLGCPVQDADAVVHELMAKKGAAVGAIDKAFPDVVVDGAVDRQALGAQVFGNEDALKKLENILHPMVERQRNEFLRESAEGGTNIVVLEVPLLFETGGHKKCDKSILITADSDIQKLRVLKRPGMTLTKLESILAHQMPDSEKRKMADYIVDSSEGMEPVLAKLQDIVKLALNETGHCWPQMYEDCK